MIEIKNLTKTYKLNKKQMKESRTTKLASEAPHPFHKILNHRIQPKTQCSLRLNLQLRSFHHL